jgi:sugar phosphate permease
VANRNFLSSRGSWLTPPSPGSVYLLTCFYTKKQIALRSAILYSGSQIGNAFGGLLALAILQADGRHGIEGWRWLFIIEGVVTIGVALIFMTFVPNKPETMRWLTPVERDRLVYRLQLDRGTVDGTEEMSNMEALKLAGTDPKVWLLCATLTLTWVCASITNFFPIVTAGLGFKSRAQTLGLTAPPYVLCVFVIALVGWHSDKYHERTFHIVIPFLFCLLANIIAVATNNTGARYFAMMLMPSSFYSAGIIILSWISTTIVGPAIKRSIAIAIINAVSNTANIWTPYLYYSAPRYVTAFAVNLAAAVCVILFALGTRTYLVRLNKKLDNGEDLGANGPTPVQVEAGFRFQL